jgi:neutral ceramidase
MLQAGVTEVSITPPVGVELAGYGPDLHRYSTDIHDPLTAQALVLDDGHCKAAIIALDVIGVAGPFVSDVRRQIETRTGIPAANVMIAASHCHTAPTLVPFREWGTPDPDYVRRVARQLVQATKTSARHLVPVQVSAGRTDHAALAWNRTGRPEVDPTVEVIRIDHRSSGEPLAILVHYACHLVTLGPVSHVSADYAGVVRQHLRERYPDSTILFLNGACGDIDPVTNREVWGQGTFEDVERIGNALGEAAWHAAESTTAHEDVVIRTAQRRTLLDYHMPSADTVREKIEYYRNQLDEVGSGRQPFGAVTESVDMPAFWLGYFEALDRRLKSGEQPTSEEIELQALYLGDDVLLLGIPAEVYTHEGVLIRQQSRCPHTLVVGYANGLVGYIPPVEEFEKATYAALLAAAVYDHPPFRADVADTLVATAMGLCVKEA